MTLRTTLIAFAAASFCLSLAAQTQNQPQPQAQAAAATTPAPAETAVHTFTGNVGVVSDYRFRGISQSWKRPAIQGGIDYSHASGFYLGNWNSSISSNSYNNGAGAEIDLYGGFKFSPIEGGTVDVGVLHYAYPSARLNSAPATPTREKYDNTELYAGYSQGPFSGKVFYAVTDYFGLDNNTAGYAYFNSLPARGGSDGTVYLDLNYNLDLGNDFTLGMHVGHTRVRRYSELSYTDIKIGVNKMVSGFNLGAAVVATNADDMYYQVGNSAGSNPRKLGGTTVVLSVGKTF